MAKLSGNPFESVLYDLEKVSIFMDGLNFYGSMKALDIQPDFGLIRSLVKEAALLQRFNYYTVVTERDDQEKSGSTVKPLLDWMDYNGITVVTRDYLLSNSSEERRRRPTIEVEMAVHMLREARTGVDHFLLFTGDGNYVPVVNELRSLGKKVTVISHLEGVSDLLRRSADDFLDLKKVAHYFVKGDVS